MADRLASIRGAVGPRIKIARTWAAGTPAWIARRWPSTTWMTRGLLSTAGALGLVVVLVAAVVLGPLSSRRATAATPSPSDWDLAAGLKHASPTPDRPYDTLGPISTWTFPPTLPPTPAPTPTPGPTAPQGTRLAHILATADCQNYPGQGEIVVENTIYATCGLGLGNVSAFDATTGRKLADYIYDVRPEGMTAAHLAIDNGVWFSTVPIGSACGANCPAWTPRVRRMYMGSSRAITFTLDGWVVAGDGLGYVWAKRPNASGPTQMKIDPATTKTSQIPWAYPEVEIACGALWGATADRATVARVDPASGDVLATFAVPGGLKSLHQTQDGCWSVQGASYGPGHDERFVKIGPSGIESGSPAFTISDFGSLLIVGSTFWIASFKYSSEPDNWVLLQRVDPSTWQRVGPVWAVPLGFGDPRWAFAAGGAMWIQSSTEYGGDLLRVDVPLGPLPATSPSPSSTPKATPTAPPNSSSSPTASPSPSPSPAPSA